MAIRFTAAAGALNLLALGACDPQRIRELEEGVATEADVRERFGALEIIWKGPAGERVFEYNRQPAGQRNFMITIGRDGPMTALRQVLHPVTFSKVHAGMAMEDVHRLLGKPMTITPYALTNAVAWDWRYLQPPNTPMVFTVWFGPDDHVLGAGAAPDPQAPENR